MYRRGRRLEWLMRDKLEKEGYFVTRAAGSKGIADLVAIKFLGNAGPHNILLVSCKKGQWVPPDERKEMLVLSKRLGATPYFTKKDGGEWQLEEVRP